MYHFFMFMGSLGGMIVSIKQIAYAYTDIARCSVTYNTAVQILSTIW